MLADAAAELVCETLPPPPVEGLVFVPPDGERMLRRGHNPARQLALGLGARWGLPVGDVLRRTRRASSAARALADGAAQKRRRRLPCARRADADVLCVVDDVYTTGATASAAASALRVAGARTIHVVTLARTVRLSASP